MAQSMSLNCKEPFLACKRETISSHVTFACDLTMMFFAAQIAGIDKVKLIKEPVASAFAYGLDLQEDQTVLVFDLGGGTFDVSILELGGGVIEVRLHHSSNTPFSMSTLVFILSCEHVPSIICTQGSHVIATGTFQKPATD